jgi:C4-dicarboxylate-specific signal transduction histidine kinase
MQEANIGTPTIILCTRYDENEYMLNIVIENNGPDIDNTTKQRLFEPFFTTKEEGIATGECSISLSPIIMMVG